MLTRVAIAWAVLAAVFGFVLGGSIVSVSLQTPPSRVESTSNHKPHEQGAEQHGPLRRFWNWTTHDPVAFYTFILAIFTAVLAISTVGLGVATIGLYRAGERQIAVAEIAANAATAANRPW